LTYNSKSHLIIVPTYNEIENISVFINEFVKLDISLLIVDDSSPDGTGTYVKNIMKSIPNIHLIERESKLGLGSAYREGFNWGLINGYSYFIEMDADFSHSFNDLKKLLNYSKNSDVVIGSRYISGGGSTGWDIRRKLLSKTANKISQILLKSSISDMTSGFRCYSKDSLLKIKYSDTNSDGYSFQIEMTLRSIENNLSIKEVPIIFNERRLGNSKMSKSIVFEALLFLLSNGIKRWLNLKIS
jgi:dolichol-phosphate mannosyltransferase